MLFPMVVLFLLFRSISIGYHPLFLMMDDDARCACGRGAVAASCGCCVVRRRNSGRNPLSVKINKLIIQRRKMIDNDRGTNPDDAVALAVTVSV